jgi:hypothetical protein
MLLRQNLALTWADLWASGVATRFQSGSRVPQDIARSLALSGVLVSLYAFFLGEVWRMQDRTMTKSNSLVDIRRGVSRASMGDDSIMTQERSTKRRSALCAPLVSRISLYSGVYQ